MLVRVVYRLLGRVDRFGVVVVEDGDFFVYFYIDWFFGILKEGRNYYKRSEEGVDFIFRI